eukprot:691858-Hanusia_phi.AAC.2
MPLGEWDDEKWRARMMARSETFQERASTSPGLQAFLDKKAISFSSVGSNNPRIAQRADVLKTQTVKKDLIFASPMLAQVNATGSDGNNNTDVGASEDYAQQAFAGRHGWVVTWLLVEGSTALGLPLVSISSRQSGSSVSVNRAMGACLTGFPVGCLWVFGGFVPEPCIDGRIGDNFAYSTMW